MSGSTQSSRIVEQVANGKFDFGVGSLPLPLIDPSETRLVAIDSQGLTVPEPGSTQDLCTSAILKAAWEGE